MSRVLWTLLSVVWFGALASAQVCGEEWDAFELRSAAGEPLFALERASGAVASAGTLRLGTLDVAAELRALRTDLAAITAQLAALRAAARVATRVASNAASGPSVTATCAAGESAGVCTNGATVANILSKVADVNGLTCTCSGTYRQTAGRIQRTVPIPMQAGQCQLVRLRAYPVFHWRFD